MLGAIMKRLLVLLAAALPLSAAAPAWIEYGPDGPIARAIVTNGGECPSIVIDADVPHHSGYGVLAYLREEVGEDLRHVIFMTASSDRDAVRRNFGERLTVVGRDQAVDEITRVLEG